MSFGNFIISNAEFVGVGGTDLGLTVYFIKDLWEHKFHLQVVFNVYNFVHLMYYFSLQNCS